MKAYQVEHADFPNEHSIVFAESLSKAKALVAKSLEEWWSYSFFSAIAKTKAKRSPEWDAQAMLKNQPYITNRETLLLQSKGSRGSES